MEGIYFFYEGAKPSFNEQQVVHYLRKIAHAEGHEIRWLNIIFCSANDLYHLNAQYLGHKTHTDIITFDYTEEEGLCGELYLGVPRIQENARHYSEGFVRELWRVIIHGLLHLVGYKDGAPHEQKAMRVKEAFYMEKHPLHAAPCSTGNIHTA